MKKRSNLFRGAAGVFLAVMVIFGIVGSVANSWAGKVNELLNTSGNTISRSTDPDDYTYKSDYESGSELIQAQIDLNTRLEAEGAVCLKGTPAVEGTAVTLFGMRSGSQMQFGGSMGELVYEGNVVTLAEALTENGFQVNPTLTQFYEDMEANYAPTQAASGNMVDSYEEQGALVNEVPVSEYAALGSDAYTGYTNAAVVVFGRDAGESCSFYPGENGLADPSEFTQSTTGNILSLSDDERDLLELVKGLGFDKIIVLLNSSTSMEVEELKQDDAIDCVLWIGNPGAYGTYGIAKLLSGELLPSGHLTDTFAVNSALSPAAQNYGVYTFTNASEIDTTSNNALRSSWYLVETEGIYTGYRYYETRYFDSVAGQGNAATALNGETVDGGSVWNYDNEVSWSFGYGLEGSEFTEEIVDTDIDWNGECSVTVRVTNVGTVAAKHTVQLYVSLPYTDYDKANGIEKSAIQLVGYAKTGEAQEETYSDYVLLQPNESEDVTITFDAEDLYSYDELLEHDGVVGAYLLEAGDYYFATGNGAHDAVQAVLQQLHPLLTQELTPTGTVYKVTVDAQQVITESNDTLIQNRLESADLNSMDCGTTVTYLTRSDWAGTFPVSVEGVTATDEMITLLRNATYDADEALANYDGPTSFTYGADNGVTVADLVGLDYDDELYDKLLDELTLEELCNQYIAYLEELESITMPIETRADSPLGVIATIGQQTKGTIYEVSEDDPAYGYHTNNYVGAPVAAATFSHLLLSEEGRLIGNDCLWTGYTTWYGPGMNLHRTPYNGRNVGYYSEDALLTGRASADLHASLVKYGVVTNVKHFAFNDQETNRDGIAVFLDEQAAREGELRGFQIAIREGNVKGLMSSFNRVGCTYIGACQELMNGILRGEWGFNGHLITDSVKSNGYFLPREALLAGNDQMLGGSNNGTAWAFTADDVKDDIVIQAGLRESMHRKLYVYANSALMNGITAESSASGGLSWWATMLWIFMGIGLVGFVTCIVFYVLNVRKENRTGGAGNEE